MRKILVLLLWIILVGSYHMLERVDGHLCALSSLRMPDRTVLTTQLSDNCTPSGGSIPTENGSS